MNCLANTSKNSIARVGDMCACERAKVSFSMYRKTIGPAFRRHTSLDNEVSKSPEFGDFIFSAFRMLFGR